MNKYHIKRIVCGVYNVMISDFRRLNRGVYDILEYKYYSIRLPYIYLMKIYQPFKKINTHFAKREDKAKLTPRVIDYF